MKTLEDIYDDLSTELSFLSEKYDLPIEALQSLIQSVDDLSELVEMKNINYSMEQKLDKIIELLEKLVPKEVEIKSGISINTDFDAAKFNEVLTRITNRISRASSVSPKVVSKEELVKRLSEVDWDKVLADKHCSLLHPSLSSLNPTKEESIERAKGIDWFSSTESRFEKAIQPKIKIACRKSTLGDNDEKGEVFILDGTVQEDGTIVCEPMTETRTIVGWS